jgi:hypothetical protein
MSCMKQMCHATIGQSYDQIKNVYIGRNPHLHNFKGAFSHMSNMLCMYTAAMHIGCRFYSRRLLWYQKTGHENCIYFDQAKNSQLDKR